MARLQPQPVQYPDQMQQKFSEYSPSQRAHLASSRPLWFLDSMNIMISNTGGSQAAEMKGSGGTVKETKQTLLTLMKFPSPLPGDAEVDARLLIASARS